MGYYGLISFMKTIILNTSKIKFSNVYNKIYLNQVEFILGIQEEFLIKKSIHEIYSKRLIE